MVTRAIIPHLGAQPARSLRVVFWPAVRVHSDERSRGCASPKRMKATDIPRLAAAHAFGLVKNHLYRDGTKRIGLLAMVTLFGVNGYAFEATDEDVVTKFIALAADQVSEDEMATWIQGHSNGKVGRWVSRRRRISRALTRDKRRVGCIRMLARPSAPGGAGLRHERAQHRVDT